MIFVTVGEQLPFDRLVKAVDEWAGERGRSDVFAQVGAASYEPRHVEWKRFLEPADFRARLEGARALVAHAGMGTVITALEVGKPVIIMPRKHALREQRNDHQLATAERFRGRSGVRVAMDEHELLAELDAIDRIAAGEPIRDRASAELLDTLRGFAQRVARERGRG